VYTSGALFCFSGVLVIIFHLFVPFNLAGFLAAIQGIILLLFCGIYFLVLASGDIPIGGLLDFILIEIPTFIYIGIFLQIILVGYWVFFTDDEMSTNAVIAAVVGVLLLNWIVFAAIVIAVAFSNSISTVSKFCDCQLSGDIQQSDTAQIIRIVYKSFMLVVAICVFVLTAFLGQKLLKKMNAKVYYQVLILSLGLLFDCLAFLIYYAINKPTAYFLVILWFTELLPICVVNGIMASKYFKFHFREMRRSFTLSSSTHSSRAQ